MLASVVTELSGVVSSRNSSWLFVSGVVFLFWMKDSLEGSLTDLSAVRARITPPVTIRASTRPITTATVASFFTFILETS